GHRARRPAPSGRAGTRSPRQCRRQPTRRSGPRGSSGSGRAAGRDGCHAGAAQEAGKEEPLPASHKCVPIIGRRGDTSMQHTSLVVSLAAVLGVASLQAQSNNIVEGPKPAPAAKPEISLEMRGDIYMARKMYREAIDTFRASPMPDPVLLNKTG